MRIYKRKKKIPVNPFRNEAFDYSSSQVESRLTMARDPMDIYTTQGYTQHSLKDVNALPKDISLLPMDISTTIWSL